MSLQDEPYRAVLSHPLFLVAHPKYLQIAFLGFGRATLSLQDEPYRAVLSHPSFLVAYPKYLRIAFLGFERATAVDY